MGVTLHRQLPRKAPTGALSPIDPCKRHQMLRGNFMKFGDVVKMNARASNNQTPFGKIDQTVVKASLT
jgi:hypothetical protein